MQTIHERLVNTAHTTTSQTDSCTQPATNNEATAPETTPAPPSTEQNHSFGDAQTRPPKILRRSGFSYPRIPSASGFSLRLFLVPVGVFGGLWVLFGGWVLFWGLWRVCWFWRVLRGVALGGSVNVWRVLGYVLPAFNRLESICEQGFCAGQRE